MVWTVTRCWHVLDLVMVFLPASATGNVAPCKFSKYFQNKRQEEFLNKKEFLNAWLSNCWVFPPTERLPIQNNIQNRLSFQQLFVVLKFIYQKLSWTALYRCHSQQTANSWGLCNTWILILLLQCEKNQKHLSISELPVWALIVISSRSWTNAFILFHNEGSTAVIGNPWLDEATELIQSLLIATTNSCLNGWRALDSTQCFIPSNMKTGN